jgi:processive 1,2-diacylglycerol beta-glucosyltransferase
LTLPDTSVTIKLMNRILVLYLSIGSGHQVGAEAIAAALRSHSTAEVICRDPIAEHSTLLSSIMNTSNSLSAVIFPRLYTKIWSGGQARSITNWTARHGSVACEIRSVIDAIQPDAIVSTHALPALIAAHYKRDSEYKIIGMISDYGAHAYWPHPAVDRYCTPSVEAANDLIKRGIDPKRVSVTGLPIRSYPVPDRSAAPDGRLKVLILTGGRRSGPYQLASNLIITALPDLDRLDLPIEITIVTGANQSVHQHLASLKLRHPIELAGLVDDVQARMAHADIVVGKTGGMMVAESLASGAALIALTPGPGQETANANFLKKHQLSIICNRPAEFIAALNQLVSDRTALRQLQRTAKNFGRPNAADDVARVVLSC